MKCPICGKEEFVKLGPSHIFVDGCDYEQPSSKYLCINCGHVEQNEIGLANKYKELNKQLDALAIDIKKKVKELLLLERQKRYYSIHVLAAFNDREPRHEQANETYELCKSLEDKTKELSEAKTNSKKAEILFRFIKDEYSLFLLKTEEMSRISKDISFEIVDKLVKELIHILSK